MKKLISICFLFFFVVIGNAQENKKPKWSELNQDQLNLALTESTKNIKRARILTLAGVGALTIGTVMLYNAEHAAILHDEPLPVWYYFVAGGAIMTIAGIRIWIVDGKKKKNITLELVKFNPPGSASINGVGLKIRF